MLNRLFQLIPVKGQVSEFFVAAPLAITAQLQSASFVPLQAGGFCRPAQALLSLQRWNFGPEITDGEASALKRQTASLVTRTGLRMVHQGVTIPEATAQQLGIRVFDFSLWSDLLQQAVQAWTETPDELDVGWMAWALANIYNGGRAPELRDRLTKMPLLPLTNGSFATVGHGTAYDLGSDAAAAQVIAALPDARVLNRAFTEAVKQHPGAVAMLGLLGVKGVTSVQFLREQLAPTLCDPAQSSADSAVRLMLSVVSLAQLETVTVPQFTQWVASHGSCVLFAEDGQAVESGDTEAPLVFSSAFSKLGVAEKMDELEAWPADGLAPSRHALLAPSYIACLLKNADASRQPRSVLCRTMFELLEALGVRRLFTVECDDESNVAEMPALCDLLQTVTALPACTLKSLSLWRGLVRHEQVLLNKATVPADGAVFPAAHFSRTRELLATTAWVKCAAGMYVSPGEATRQSADPILQRLGDLVLVAEVPINASNLADWLGLRAGVDAQRLAERWRSKCVDGQTQGGKATGGSPRQASVSLSQSESVLSVLSSDAQALKVVEDVPFIFVPNHAAAYARSKGAQHTNGPLKLDPLEPISGTFERPARCVVEDKSHVFDSDFHNAGKDAILLAQRLGGVRVLERSVIPECDVDYWDVGIECDSSAERWCHRHRFFSPLPLFLLLSLPLLLDTIRRTSLVKRSRPYGQSLASVTPQTRPW